jgi:hypothetical protein
MRTYGADLLRTSMSAGSGVCSLTMLTGCAIFPSVLLPAVAHGGGHPAPGAIGRLGRALRPGGVPGGVLRGQPLGQRALGRQDQGQGVRTPAAAQWLRAAEAGRIGQ